MAERFLTISPAEREALIRTVIAEAGGENPIGQIAVAQVILNRVKSDRYPDTIQGVVSQDKQFSSYGNKLYNSDLDSPDGTKVSRVVDMLLDGSWNGGDPTQGGTHFYSTKMMKDKPYWWDSESKKGSVQIGGHKFAKGSLKNSQEDDGWKFDLSSIFGSPAEASTIQEALNSNVQNNAQGPIDATTANKFVDKDESILATILNLPQWLLDVGSGNNQLQTDTRSMLTNANMNPVPDNYELPERGQEVPPVTTIDGDNSMVNTSINGGSGTQSDTPFRLSSRQSNLLTNLSRGLLTQPDISSALAKAQELTQDQEFGNQQFANKGYSMGQVYMAPNGRDMYEAVFDRAKGKMMYKNTTTGEFVDKLPPASVPYSQSGESSFNIQSGKDLAHFRDAVQGIPRSMRNITSLRQLIDSSEDFVGPTVSASIRRNLANTFGLEFGGNLDDVTEARRALRDMMVESAKALKGQGQITENERKMLADSLANPENMTPNALNKALDILEKGLRGKIAKMDAWRNTGLNASEWADWSQDWDFRVAKEAFESVEDLLDNN